MSLIRLLLAPMLLLTAGSRLLPAQQSPPARQSDTVTIRIDSSGHVAGCRNISNGVACTRTAAAPRTKCSMPTVRPDTTRVVAMPSVRADSMHTQPMPVAVPGCTPDKKK
jgi:hypothetical protein